MALTNAQSDDQQISASTPAEDDTKDIIIVVVGEKKKIFKLDRALLMSCSLFFRGCLSSDFQESQSGRINLLEDDPRAFRIIVDCIHGKLGSISHPILEKREKALIDAYYLADMLIMFRCKNDIMDHIRKSYTGNCVSSKTMTFLRIDVNSHLNDFYIQKYAHSMMSRPSNVRLLDTRANFETISLFGGEGDIAAAIMWRMIIDLNIQEGSERSDNLFVLDPAAFGDCLYHDHGGDEMLEAVYAVVEEWDATKKIWPGDVV